MQRYVIDDLIAEIRHCVETHRLTLPGEYSRWIFGEGKYLGVNEYGCADAANILYTIGYFPSDPEMRAADVAVLQGMQDPVTGMFSEATHHPLHTTAHCTAALELYDAKPLYPCRALEKYTTKEGLYDLLENGIRWDTAPWRDSHLGAGILPALTNADMVGLEWKDWYFDWMWEHTDSETGFIYAGTQKQAPLYEYMASGFHYMFNHEIEHRPQRYPERVIDTCLKLINDGLEGANGMLKLARVCDFIDIDVIYTLTRSMRQTVYKFDEGKRTLERFAERYIDMMYSLDYEHDESFNDLHTLFAAVCCLAELQSALPGKIITTQPLRLVLDRRPFI